MPGLILQDCADVMALMVTFSTSPLSSLAMKSLKMTCSSRARVGTLNRLKRNIRRPDYHCPKQYVL